MNATLIAIIGMACHYPGARELRTFWENILTKRRQFRPLPDTRLPASEYYDPDPAAPDTTYCRKAGLIDGLSFDPAQYRIPRSTFESSDIVHWLALKVALASLDDAGLSKETVPKEQTGVILGNTLTGEHARAQGLRLRWPFVRRVLEKTALEKGLSAEHAAELLATAEAYYKSVFTPITEDSLAGALSNTIAGRICNYLDLHGGGYTVDGACSSSLIAAATAATHLVNRDMDLALAGGVDISLDTFELVGFAKTAALATEDMRVYDRRANGFIPGEGCGFVVMKRLEDALADGDYVYAVLHGWGISSDGKGGLTAPNAKGQARALQRAYKRAGWDIHDLDFIEGHGTGTAVGDTTELEGIALAINTADTVDTVNTDDGAGARHAVSRQDESTPLRRCGMTSLKSLIGHTKAASGVGALIKTVIALNQRILPPLANCFDPHPVFSKQAEMLYPLLHGEIRSPRETLRAGISGMGFGGINSHLALASADPPSPKLKPVIREQKLLADYQSTELFIFSAGTVEELLDRVQLAQDLAQNICEGERADLAAHLVDLYGQGNNCGPVRAAITAESPEMLLDALAELAQILRRSPPEAQQTSTDPRSGLCIGNDIQSYRVGFLFPGQGSQKINMGRQLVQRYDWAENLVQETEKALGWPEGQQLRDYIFRPLEKARDASQIKKWQEQLKQSEITQPALCLTSMLRLEQLARLGIQPDAVGGHSLGELTAFYAAGAYSGEELIRFAALRGQAMAPEQGHAGIMASLACSAAQAQTLLDTGLDTGQRGYAVVANKNSPSQTVISGEPSCIEQACRHAEKQGIQAVLLPVANAFHSRFVSRAAQTLAESQILPEQPRQLSPTLFSGLQERKIDLNCDLRKHFSEQVISPVDFISLVQEMSRECDLLLEVGPGRVLTGLARNITGEATGNEKTTPFCFPLESEPEQDKDLHLFLANYFVRGGTINWPALYEDRLVRPFIPAAERIFLTNPCELPFPEHKEKAPSSLPLHSQEQNKTGQPDRLLAEFAGISEDDLMAYLKQRGRFLGGLIRVDLDNMSSRGEESVHRASQASEISLKQIIPQQSDEQAENREENEEQSVEELLFVLIEERTGFSRKSLSMELRLLDDLNLDSIKASELIAEAAKRIGAAAARLNISEYANATLQEISALLTAEAEQATDITEHSSSKYPGWVRDFILQYRPEPLSFEQMEGQASWLYDKKVLILFEATEQHIAKQLKLSCIRFSAEVHLLTFAQVRQRTASLSARWNHVIALLPQEEVGKAFDQHSLIKYMSRLHTVFSADFYKKETDSQAIERSFAVVQFNDGFFGDGSGAANSCRFSAKSLAAALHFEQPDLKVRVLDISLPISAKQLCEYIVAELSGTKKYAAVGYAADQIRRVPYPILRTSTADQARPIRWSPKDVVLATGGAKGITAECVLVFARAAGVQLALVGSSSPSMRNEQHDEILHTLKRAHEAGLSAHYYQCDITDAGSVRKLVCQVEKKQGRITGLVHGSGLNRPGELRHVSFEHALEEISPKLIGAMNLCTALRDRPPKLFIALSSFIGITGLPQNGWYGFSNEALHLLLRRYGATEPGTATLSIAFSIWDEVGMGIRMGSTSRLSKLGMEALSVQEGTARFLRLAMHDPKADQVIITARPAGLDTFSVHGTPLPQGLRFIDRVSVHHPGIELISKTELTLERDPYIRDHCWRGTYLFPLVFGLEAMAQAVCAVTGIRYFDAVCIEDIELARPIIVPKDAGSEIEIHALVLEAEKPVADPRIQVHIRTGQTEFRVDHFSATFLLRTAVSPVQQKLPKKLVPIDILPETDLYKEELLFQGPLYQRIRRIFQLSSESCLFSTLLSRDSAKDSEENRILGDPFFRDSLLQSGQLPLPQHLCLPAHIQRIERFPATDRDDKFILGTAIIEEHTEKYITGTVTALNPHGQVIERISGYRAQILDHRTKNPTAEDLVSPGQRDRRIMLRALEQREVLMPVRYMLPKFSSDFIPGLDSSGKYERRKKELPFIRTALKPLLHSFDSRVEISWSQAGKPLLAIPTDAGVHFSLSHHQGTIICTAGYGPQGCDLEAVCGRSKEEWLGLLGQESDELLSCLIEQGDNLSRGGSRLWTAFESIFKALGHRPDASMMRVVEKQGDTVLFFYNYLCILTFPVRLTLRGERMLAVLIPEKCRKRIISEQVPVSGNIDAWPNKVGSFTHEFTTTFLEGRGPEGKVYFTNIPVWMGELRELALLPIAEHLVQDMKSRQWGMVTNRSFFSVEQQLDSYDTVIGEVRLLEDTDLSRSFLSLAFKWFKKQEDGSLVHAVSGKLATTWVGIQGHGTVQPADLPEYFKAYLEKLSRSQDDSGPPGKNRHPVFSETSPLFAASISAKKQHLLFQQQFRTSREDSNLVGNIYFSNYYKWQARVRDHYLANELPDLSSRNPDGQFVCVHAEVHHLQEAMPFEIIEVSMYLYKIFTQGFVVYFEYHIVDKRDQSERKRKIAHGQHGVVWALCGHQLDGKLHPVTMPDEYRTHFMMMVDAKGETELQKQKKP